MVVRLSVPAKVAAARAKASYQNGVLKVTIPKMEHLWSKRAEIKLE